MVRALVGDIGTQRLFHLLSIVGVDLLDHGLVVNRRLGGGITDRHDPVRETGGRNPRKCSILMYPSSQAKPVGRVAQWGFRWTWPAKFLTEPMIPGAGNPLRPPIP